MTRGNQREKAREKNMKKQAGQKKTKDEGMTLEERRHRDAEIMRQKQEKKAAAAGSSSQGASGGAAK